MTLAIIRRNTTEQLAAEVYGNPRSVVVRLPYPPSALNPNARPHWAAKARAAKAYKNACFALLMEHRRHLKGKMDFIITFRPPDKRGRDLDNAIASMKAGQDALAIVTGVNDSLFYIRHEMGEPTPGGAVEVEVAL